VEQREELIKDLMALKDAVEEEEVCFAPVKRCKRELHTGTNKIMMCQLPIAY